MTERLHPIHLGEILLEEFLEPMGISQYRLAEDINVPLCPLEEIEVEIKLFENRIVKMQKDIAS